MDGVVRCQWQGRDLEIEPFDPKARRFRQRTGFNQTSTLDASATDGISAEKALGDPSPRPPGIYRMGANAGGLKREGGTAHDAPLAPASASDTALGPSPAEGLRPAGGSRPRVPYPPAGGRQYLANNTP